MILSCKQLEIHFLTLHPCSWKWNHQSHPKKTKSLSYLDCWDFLTLCSTWNTTKFQVFPVFREIARILIKKKFKIKNQEFKLEPGKKYQTNYIEDWQDLLTLRVPKDFSLFQFSAMNWKWKLSWKNSFLIIICRSKSFLRYIFDRARNIRLCTRFSSQHSYKS